MLPIPFTSVQVHWLLLPCLLCAVWLRVLLRVLLLLLRLQQCLQRRRDGSCPFFVCVGQQGVQQKRRITQVSSSTF